MRIEAHDRLGHPIKAEVTRVVIYDDYDNPVALAVKHRQGWIYTAHALDREFLDALKGLGIDRTVIVDSLDPKHLKKLSLK